MVHIVIMSPHLDFLLCGGEISVMCLGASEFKFLVAWVCNHQSQPTMQEWSRNTFPELALVLLPGTWSPTAIGEMTK